MPSRRRKRRRGAGVNVTKQDVQAHLEQISDTKCVQSFLSFLTPGEFNKLMKTYVKPLQKGGRRRTRKRRGGQPGAAYPAAYGTTGNGRPIKSSQNTPECGRCLHVCRCGNANRSRECRQCVSGRSMKTSRGTRRRAQDGNHGIRRRGTRGNVPELEPRSRREGPRAREDSRFDGCAPAKALCSARGSKSTACKQEKVCNDAIMAEIERLAEKNLKKGEGGESWRGQGRRHTGPKDIPPEVAEASSFAQRLLDQMPPITVPGVLFGVIATMITSYLFGRCRRRRADAATAEERARLAAFDRGNGEFVGFGRGNAFARAHQVNRMGGRRRSRHRRRRSRRRRKRRRR